MRGKGLKPYSTVKLLVYGCNSRQSMKFYLLLPKNLARTLYIILAIFYYILVDAKLCAEFHDGR
jgi:hypothetical protein